MKKVLLIVGVSLLILLIFLTFLYEQRDTPTLPKRDEIQEEKNIETDEVRPKEDALRPVNEEEISYTLQNDRLQITYNYGEDWIEVPVDKDYLFAGEYTGDKGTLIPDSFMLTEDRAAFLYTKETEESSKLYQIGVIESMDHGETWQEHIVTDEISAPRFRKVDFISDNFGYVIVTIGRTMSQEFTAVYLTKDGGNTWESTAEAPSERLLGYGGFIDETTGFLSYGTINPDVPDLYVTNDAGETWEEATFQMPEKYEPVFVQAEEPTKEEEHLCILVNQGPNGDYEGGEIKGKFISEDEGLTWEFSEEVDADEAE